MTADPGLSQPEEASRVREPGRITRRHRRLLSGFLILLLLSALSLAVAASYVPYFAVDLWLTQRLQRFTHPGFRLLMIAVSWPGYDYHGLIVTVSCAALLLRLRLRLEAACLVASAGIGSLVTNTVKLIIDRSRPAAELVEIYVSHSTKSFPSGHVVSYLALYGFLFYLIYVLMPVSRLRSFLLMILGALLSLVGLSRIYLGAHWASDVVGGYCLGSCWLMLVIHFYWHLKAPR
jgi:membrane-associated phospholipid phosphatase